MKILARSVLMLLALGFGMSGVLVDSTNVNTGDLGIVAEDSDTDQNRTKCLSNFQDYVVLFSLPHQPASIQALPRLLDTSSTARYKLLSVYRI